MEPAAGVTFGKYTLTDVLGQGGMARVYKAVQTGLHGFRKEVAIKQILPHAAEDERLIRSLINEARLGGRLRHPNVVEIYEFDQVGEIYYMALEYVRGPTLDQLVERAVQTHGRLPVPVALDIAMQICDGLQYAHSAVDENGSPMNLVHRDLKPGNIILSLSGQAKIMDFGIARAETNLYKTTSAETTKGTPVYMSPEQVRGGALDKRSDLFALTSIIGELVLGRTVFSGTQLFQVLQSIALCETEPIIADIEPVAPELVPIVAKGWAKDPDRRYRNAQSYKDALHEARRAYSNPPGFLSYLSALELDKPPTHKPVSTADGMMLVGSQPTLKPQAMSPEAPNDFSTLAASGDRRPPAPEPDTFGKTQAVTSSPQGETWIAPPTGTPGSGPTIRPSTAPSQETVIATGSSAPSQPGAAIEPAKPVLMQSGMLTAEPASGGSRSKAALIAALLLLFLAGGAFAAWKVGVFGGPDNPVADRDSSAPDTAAAAAAGDAELAGDESGADALAVGATADDGPRPGAAMTDARGAGAADRDDEPKPDTVAGAAVSESKPADEQPAPAEAEPPAADPADSDDGIADVLPEPEDGASDSGGGGAAETQPDAVVPPKLPDTATAPARAVRTELPDELKAMISSPDPRKRAQALKEMAAYNSPEVLQAARNALANERLPIVRGAAVDLVAAKGGRSYLNLLEGAYKSEGNPDLRLRMIETLRRKGGSRYKRVFKAALSDTSAPVRRAAAAGLARHATADDKAALQTCAQDIDAQVAATCAKALEGL